MFKLEFSTDNVAFDDGWDESARILRNIALLLEQGEDKGNIVDINGNTIGTWELT